MVYGPNGGGTGNKSFVRSQKKKWYGGERRRDYIGTERNHRVFRGKTTPEIAREKTRRRGGSRYAERGVKRKESLLQLGVVISGLELGYVIRSDGPG